MDYSAAYRELEKQVENYGTAKNYAISIGKSEAYICDIRSGKRGFSDNMLNELGFKKVCRLEKIND